jgi:excisionase family DNA binding protein
MVACDADEVLNVGEVATRLHVSRSALYALVERGQLPAHNLGDKVVFLKRELDACLNALPYRPVTRPAKSRD